MSSPEAFRSMLDVTEQERKQLVSTMVESATPIVKSAVRPSEALRQIYVYRNAQGVRLNGSKRLDTSLDIAYCALLKRLNPRPTENKLSPTGLSWSGALMAIHELFYVEEIEIVTRRPLAENIARLPLDELVVWLWQPASLPIAASAPNSTSIAAVPVQIVAPIVIAS
jgi:hypothetical protein